jgi:hypothetical protein
MPVLQSLGEMLEELRKYIHVSKAEAEPGSASLPGNIKIMGLAAGGVKKVL